MTQAEPPIRLLLVGDTRRREFYAARQSLETSGELVETAETSEAEAILAAGQFVPDVIVVAQAFPGQFSLAEIDRIRRLAPLARLLGLLGSWCEGEVRTGLPWPAVIRIYWHQWLPCWERELDRLRLGQCPAWGLPVTASEEERLLASAAAPPQRREGRILIHSPRFEMADWIESACRRHGYSTSWLQPHRPIYTEGAAAVIFDGTDAQGAELARLRQLTAVPHRPPLLALLDFPRIEDHRRVTTAGAAAVLAKPLLVDDLFWELDRVLGQVAH